MRRRTTPAPAYSHRTDRCCGLPLNRQRKTVAFALFNGRLLFLLRRAGTFRRGFLAADADTILNFATTFFARATSTSLTHNNLRLFNRLEGTRTSTCRLLLLFFFRFTGAFACRPATADTNTVFDLLATNGTWRTPTCLAHNGPLSIFQSSV